MKNIGLRIIIMLSMVGFCSQLFSMQPGMRFDPNQRWFRDFTDDIERIRREREQALAQENAQRERKKAQLDETLRYGNDAQKQDALAEKEMLRRKDAAREKERENVEHFAKRMGDIGFNVVDGMVNNAQKAQDRAHEKEKEAIKWEMMRRGIVDGVREAFTSFADPRTARSVGLCAVATFGSYYALKFGFKVLEDWYGVPELADKTTIIPLHKQIYNALMGIKVFNKTRDDIILNDELKAFLNEYIIGTKNIIAHGGYLNHILLPGPPGTGKTLMAEVIASELGLPSIYFAASNLLNCEMEIALQRLAQLFEFAKHSSMPIVIIMDEAEMIFGDRNKAASEKVSAIKNQIMANTGTEQSNFILIALTNRMQDFDKAFKSRFNNIVEVAPPAHAQRKQILELYVNSYIKNPKFKTKESYVSRLFSRKKAKKITFDEKLFDAQGIEALAKKLDGFTGRNISHLVMDIRKKVLASTEAHISQATVDSALVAMKRKVEEEHREFAAAASGATAPSPK